MLGICMWKGVETDSFGHICLESALINKNSDHMKEAPLGGRLGAGRQWSRAMGSERKSTGSPRFFPAPKLDTTTWLLL